MRFKITARVPQHIDLIPAGEMTTEVELPDNTIDFLAAVEKFGRFSVLTPGHDPSKDRLDFLDRGDEAPAQLWRLHFENDYD